MPRMSDYIKSPDAYKHNVIAVGDTGCGKTHFASSYPNSYVIFTEPDSVQTLLTSGNANNCYYFEDKDCIPDSDEALKKYDKTIESHIKQAKKLHEEGKVETLVIDNFTYLAHNYWLQIVQFEQMYSKQGNVDTLKMYGVLKDKLYRLTLMKILTFPGNVVVTVHEQMENEEVMAKKPDQGDPVVPQIMGGFRSEIAGLFSAVLYLMVTLKDKEYIYYALTSKMQQRRAKNRFNLPAVIKNPSYNSITEEIKKSLVQVKGADVKQTTNA